jgi:hypothetical protein
LHPRDKGKYTKSHIKSKEEEEDLGEARIVFVYFFWNIILNIVSTNNIKENKKN